MRLPFFPPALFLLGALALGLASDATAAPAGLPARPLDIELKSVDVKNLFALLGEVGGRPVVLDPCVQGVVDLRLKNVPLPLVFDALATRLHLVYSEAGEAIRVSCAADPSATPSTQVSLAEQAAPLPEVLARLAASANLSGVDYRATARPPVTVTLTKVRLSTALAALSDSTGLRIEIAGGKLVVDR